MIWFWGSPEWSVPFSFPCPGKAWQKTTGSNKCMQNGRRGTCLHFSGEALEQSCSVVVSWKSQKNQTLHPLQVLLVLQHTEYSVMKNLRCHLIQVSFHLPFSLLPVLVLLLFFLSSIQPLQLNWIFDSQRQQQFSASKTKQFWAHFLSLALWDTCPAAAAEAPAQELLEPGLSQLQRESTGSPHSPSHHGLGRRKKPLPPDF